ncbi:hypothetical protein D5278_06655 [bacterium 1XD21-13]|nr:hypothetical protein [bacterium 1XD21-13]
MRIYVKRENWNGGLWVTLPISDGKAEEIIEELKKQHPSKMTPFIGEVETPFKGLEEALAGAFVFEGGHLDKLNQLAGEITKMNEKERFRFQGAITMENPQSLENVITAFTHLKYYSLHEGITSYEELGRYAVRRQGKRIPKELEEFFDYEEQGRFWGQQHGYLTEGGWVEKDVYPEAKEKALEECKKRREAMLVVEVRQERPEVHYQQLSLPLSTEELEKKLEECRTKGQQVVRIKGTSLTGNLYEFLPPGCSLKELNEIAEAVYHLEEKTRINWMRLLGALEAETPSNAEEACQVIRNYENYELLPRKTKNPELYARYVLEQKGSEIPDHIKRYLRYQELGQKMSMEAGLVETSYGMILNHRCPIRREEWKEEELCFFHPLSIVQYDKEQDFLHPKPLSGKEALAFKEVIKERIEKSLKEDGEQGIASSLKNQILKQKIKAMLPGVKEDRGELKGTLTVKTRAALTEAERRELWKEWEKIAHFGWGEQFYETPIKVGNQELYVGFFQEEAGSSLREKFREEHQKEEGGSFEIKL